MIHMENFSFSVVIRIYYFNAYRANRNYDKKSAAHFHFIPQHYGRCYLNHKIGVYKVIGSNQRWSEFVSYQNSHFTHLCINHFYRTTKNVLYPKFRDLAFCSNEAINRYQRWAWIERTASQIRIEIAGSSPLVVFIWTKNQSYTD